MFPLGKDKLSDNTMLKGFFSPFYTSLSFICLPLQCSSQWARAKHFNMIYTTNSYVSLYIVEKKKAF